MGEYIEVGNGKAIKLEEWKGFFSITQHRQYQEKWYWDAVRTVKGKDEVAEKNSPAKVQLGDKIQALKALRQILSELIEEATR